MRRSTLVIAGLCAILLALTGPAGSAHSRPTSAPRPADFSRSLPAMHAVRGADGARAAAHSPEPPVRYVSSPVRAPHRFDLVGVPRSERAVEFRTRRAGAGWSAWTEADPANPVWAGGADFVQIRSRHGRPRGRLFFVRVPRHIGARASAKAPVAGPAGVISREQWGGDASCKPRSSPAYGEVKAAVVHHTVSENDYTEADAPSVVLGICRFHRNGNGWNDIGYNALVDRFGHIYEGRAGGLDKPVIGAQVAGYNSETTGVASIGTHSTQGASPEAVAAIQRWLSWKLSVHNVPANGRTTITSHGGTGNRHASGTKVAVDTITGHRVLNSTACPGTALFGQLAQIRSGVRVVAVQRAILTATPGARSLVYPAPAVVRGSVTASDSGAALAGARLRLDVEGRRGWRVLQPGVAAADGSFAFSARLAGSHRLRVRVLRQGGYAGTASPRFSFLVRPAVTIRASAASRLETGGLARFVATTTPRKARAVLIVYRSSRGSFRRIARVSRRYRGRPGRFVFDYRPRRAGVYRFFVYVRADRTHAAGRSEVLTQRIEPQSGGQAP